LTIVIAVTFLNAGEQANGYLNAAIGIGGVTGAIASGVLVLRRSLARPLLVGSIVSGVGLAALGAIPLLSAALVACAVCAAGAIVVDVVLTTIFQRLVPDELRGRAMGALMTLNTLSAAGGALILPILVVQFGMFAALGVGAIAMVGGAVTAIALLGGAATRPATPFESTIARVAKLPIFAGVPASGLEAALGQVRQVDILKGQAIIRQGETADRFYIVQTGSFIVSQEHDGMESELRRLGPDQVFGEIGLLNHAPRSATVTAAEDGVLLEMDGADFLSLVGADGDVRGQLLGLYAGGGASRG
jgi:MFS family permease